MLVDRRTSNVQVVRRAYAAWESGDLSGMLELLADDLVTRRFAPLPDEGTFYGREGMLDLIADWIAEFDDLSMYAQEYVDAGDEVVVGVRQVARGHRSQVPVEATFWFVHTIADGKICRFDLYATRDQALEAVGLRAGLS